MPSKRIIITNMLGFDNPIKKEDEFIIENIMSMGLSGFSSMKHRAELIVPIMLDIAFDGDIGIPITFDDPSEEINIDWKDGNGKQKYTKSNLTNGHIHTTLSGSGIKVGVEIYAKNISINNDAMPNGISHINKITDWGSNTFKALSFKGNRWLKSVPSKGPKFKTAISYKDMFLNCSLVNFSVNGWDFSNHTMKEMFTGCNVWNNGNVDFLNDTLTNNSIIIENFKGLEAFNQKITLNLTKKTNLDSMLEDCYSFSKDVVINSNGHKFKIVDTFKNCVNLRPQNLKFSFADLYDKRIGDFIDSYNVVNVTNAQYNKLRGFLINKKYMKVADTDYLITKLIAELPKKH